MPDENLEVLAEVVRPHAQMPRVVGDGHDTVIAQDNAAGQEPARTPARGATDQAGKATGHGLSLVHSPKVSSQLETSAWNVHDTAPSQ